MAEDLIRYDILAQDALRGVVRKVLSEVARTGLPGDHHFFVSFATRAPGVRISSRLLAQYPDEMTIVLQHQYRDLTVSEHAFEVSLSFDNVAERLLVPFTALKGFADPSVQFGLQFELATAPVTNVAPAPEDSVAPPASVPAMPLQDVAAPEPAAAVETADATDAGEDAAETSPAEAEIVSLDAFRKKS